VEDVVVTTSSGDMVVDCCITLVCAVDIPSTSDVVLANCDVETTDGAVVFSEEAIFPEVNAVFEEMRGIGDISAVVTSAVVILGARVVIFGGIRNNRVLVVISSVNVGRLLVSVLGGIVVSILAVDTA